PQGDDHARHLEVRRHQGDPQRHAGGQAGLRGGRVEVRAARGGGDRCREQPRQVRHRQQVAGPLPDVGLGRRPHLRDVGGAAALQGIDIQGILDGARAMDAVTRSKEPLRNPSALLALMWYHAGGGRGAKDMVVLPYKDRLELFSRYLQQLVMESLGKEHDLNGRVVHQGIAVYGNKGSTDQHAYVQQLRDGVNNFFVTFIEVLRDRRARSMPVDPGVTSG